MYQKIIISFFQSKMTDLSNPKQLLPVLIKPSAQNDVIFKFAANNVFNFLRKSEAL
jgi:hypothetical protein